MLSIRLARTGKRNQPSYRVIVCQKHKDALGDYIENIGFINYFGKEKTIKLNKEKVEHWLKNGAQPTATVHNLLVSQGIIKADKIKPSGINSQKKKVKELKSEATTGLKTKDEGSQAKEEETNKTKAEQPKTIEEKPAEAKPADKTEEIKPEEKSQKKTDPPATETKTE